MIGQLRAHPLAKSVGVLLIACVLLTLPFALAMAGTAWVRITNLAILFVLLSLGLNIVVGFAGLLDLGYIAFYAVGAYTYALLASPHFNLHWPWWAILPIGAAIACFFGVLLGAPTLKLRGDYLAIVTLGFGEIIRVFVNNLDAPLNITNGPKGISQIDEMYIGFNLGKTHEVLGTDIPKVTNYYYLFLALVVVAVLICYRLERSRIGRAWMAIREDEIAAKAMGINTRNMKLLAFGMGATFGGVSGTMFAAFGPTAPDAMPRTLSDGYCSASCRLPPTFSGLAMPARLRRAASSSPVAASTARSSGVSVTPS